MGWTLRSSNRRGGEEWGISISTYLWEMEMERRSKRMSRSRDWHQPVYPEKCPQHRSEEAVNNIADLIFKFIWANTIWRSTFAPEAIYPGSESSVDLFNEKDMLSPPANIPGFNLQSFGWMQIGIEIKLKRPEWNLVLKTIIVLTR